MIKTLQNCIIYPTLSLPFNVANSEILKFESGSYEGEVKKGKAHGVGKFTFSDGSVYEGNLKEINLMEKENIRLNQEKFLKENGDVIVFIRK